jgi:two-component system osmolarity sensor histidine kinase EnvZ
MAWLKSGLFWRTFFLLTFLITGSMTAWLISFKSVESTPKARQLAEQIVSIVTITRAALTHSAEEKRDELLYDLMSHEGIRIYLLDDDEKVELPPFNPFQTELQNSIRNRLGKDTRFAVKVNGESGFWVSFSIDGDEYWLRLDQGRINSNSGAQIVSWAMIALLLSLLGAVFISRLINQPLARLSSAAWQIAQGKRPEPLPEKGPREIRETNQSFNQMVEDLTRIESDRAIILAGISHDLRTPLARMQLEVEMARLTEEARTGMQSDLEQMDAIIGQFLDFARPSSSSTYVSLDISELLTQVISETTRLSDITVTAKIDRGLSITGNETDLRRLFNNLIENARRYGKTPGQDMTHLEVQCDYREKKQGISLSFRDHGNGVPKSELNRLMRPFTRVDSSRSQVSGSGLGLAIVERIVKRHKGKIAISNHLDGGFQVQIEFRFDPSLNPPSSILPFQRS